MGICSVGIQSCQPPFCTLQCLSLSSEHKSQPLQCPTRLASAAVQFRCRRLSLAPVLHRTGLLAVLSPGHSCSWPLLPAPGLQSTSLGAHRARIPISSLRAYQQGQLKCSMPQAPTLPLQPGTPASLPVSLFSKANVNFPPIMGPSLPPSLSPVLDRAHLEQLPFPRVSLGHRDVPPGW